MACKNEQQNLWITRRSCLTVRRLKTTFFSVCRGGGQIFSQTVLGPYPGHNRGSKSTIPTFASAISAFPTRTARHNSLSLLYRVAEHWGHIWQLWVKDCKILYKYRAVFLFQTETWECFLWKEKINLHKCRLRLTAVLLHTKWWLFSSLGYGAITKQPGLKIFVEQTLTTDLQSAWISSVCRNAVWLYSRASRGGCEVSYLNLEQLLGDCENSVAMKMIWPNLSSISIVLDWWSSA